MSLFVFRVAIELLAVALARSPWIGVCKNVPSGEKVHGISTVDKMDAARGGYGPCGALLSWGENVGLLRGNVVPLR